MFPYGLRHTASVCPAMMRSSFVGITQADTRESALARWLKIGFPGLHGMDSDLNQHA
jgi:hypothetical protein